MNRHPGNIRDPFVLYHQPDDLYYLTATGYPFWPGAGENDGVRLWSSRDLVQWNDRGLIVNSAEMPADAWCKHRFWAPEMFVHKGKYYLVFSCHNENDAEDAKRPLGMFLAKSDRIDGPYTIFDINKPLIPEGGIDGSFFCDDDGTVYLTYAWGGIHMCEFDLENGKTITTPKKILSSGEGEEWDAHPYTEGNFLAKRSGIYYLWYSNPKTSYEMGIATTDDLTKPFVKHPDNPVISGTGTPIHFAGHNSCFKLRDGRDAVAFHGHGLEDTEHLCIDIVKYPPVSHQPPLSLEI